MDRQLAERMVGAAVLLGVLVLVVPFVLDGSGRDGSGSPGADTDASLDLRTHTIHLDGDVRRPPVPRPRAGPEAVPDPVPTPVPESSPAPSQEITGSPADQQPAATVATPGSADVKGSEATAEPPKQAPATSARVPPPATAQPPAARTAVVPAAAGTARAAESAAGWVVQLGSFSQKENAERLAKQAAERGFQVSVSPTTAAGRTVHRVRSGAFGSRDEADRLAGRLQAAGYPNQVMRQ